MLTHDNRLAEVEAQISMMNKFVGMALRHDEQKADKEDLDAMKAQLEDVPNMALFRAHESRVLNFYKRNSTEIETVKLKMTQ